ncbi:OX-2 membrane glycoprotein-like isoform X1 [Anguilla anguilla]|uniref:OX-2 membrane glycoprotein-like isoform X1 n=1 Tax=Anguilla anguilla TaxID=7936 RepID=UPI0015AC8426|nr:OX-2 membrane glycoprotein-like isoform X1 [Anguilla anguilla]
MNARTGFLFILLNCITTPGLPAEVIVKGETTAAFGQEASFSCSLSQPDGVSQVTWQRLLKDNTVENLATFSKRFGAKVMDPHVSRIDFMEASLNSTSIIIKNVTLADDACYICSFNVYPSGSIRKQTCLTVQGIFEARAWLIPSGGTPSGVAVSCSGTGKPAPEVTWNSTVEVTAVPTEQRVSNADGTMTVTSTLRLYDFSGRSVDCLLSSPGTTDKIRKSVTLPEIVTTKDGNSASGLWIGGLFVFAVMSVVFAIALRLRRKRATCGGYSPNGRERLVRRCSCFAVSIEEEENRT